AGGRARSQEARGAAPPHSTARPRQGHVSADLAAGALAGLRAAGRGIGARPDRRLPLVRAVRGCEAEVTAMRALAALVGLLVVPLSGCASSAPPPRPAARPFEDVRRIAVVVTGDSRFSVLEHSAEPGRTFDEILTWMPSSYRAFLQPLAGLVHRGINWLLE